MLPLSHDEVVHMKASLLYKMPGNEWQKFANLRALYGHQWTHPGSQILFMGGEFGQTTEWSHDRGIVWELLQYDMHKGCQEWVRALNHFYLDHPAIWWNAFSPEGYEWISGADTENCVLAYLRKGRPTDKVLLVICHLNANAIEDYTVGVPYGGTWSELLNSDDKRFGGSGVTNGDLIAQEVETHGKAHSITFRLAPLAVQIFEGKDLPKANTKKVKAAEPVKELDSESKGKKASAAKKSKK